MNDSGGSLMPFQALELSTQSSGAWSPATNIYRSNRGKTVGVFPATGSLPDLASAAMLIFLRTENPPRRKMRIIGRIDLLDAGFTSSRYISGVALLNQRSAEPLASAAGFLKPATGWESMA